MPAHVHTHKNGRFARFIVWRGRVALYENHGLNERDLQIANDLCVKHYGKIVRKLKEMPWVKLSQNRSRRK
jgi:hypothetical protein